MTFFVMHEHLYEHFMNTFMNTFSESMNTMNTLSIYNCFFSKIKSCSLYIFLRLRSLVYTTIIQHTHEHVYVRKPFIVFMPFCKVFIKVFIKCSLKCSFLLKNCEVEKHGK